MISHNVLSPLVVISIFAFALQPAPAEPLAELSSFSVFKNVDPGKLTGGKVLVAHGPTMSFPRGLSVESCYLVAAPLQKTIALHQQWDPTRHPGLKVYLHCDVSSKPAIENFAKVSAAPDNGAVRSLIKATQKLNPASPSDLQISREETARFEKASGSSREGTMPRAVSAFWSNLLYQRALAFVAGGLSRQPPYIVDGQTVGVGDEIRRLLSEAPKIKERFKPLLETTLLSQSSAPTPSLYWELFDVEDTAAFSLGAEYGKPAGDGWQSVDAQYYASGGYCVLLTLYQMWPLKIGELPATLVWRGDYLSSAALAQLHGVERMGSGAAMMKEIQKAISVFQRDAAGSR